jgi:hypothetical protein
MRRWTSLESLLVVDVNGNGFFWSTESPLRLEGASRHRNVQDDRPRQGSKEGHRGFARPLRQERKRRWEGVQGEARLCDCSTGSRDEGLTRRT